MSNSISAIELLSIGTRTLADLWGPSWLTPDPTEVAEVVAPPSVEAETTAEPEPPLLEYCDPREFDVTPGDAVCDRCGSEKFIDHVIHHGASMRRDCEYCGRTLGFPRWHGRDERDEMVDALGWYDADGKRKSKKIGSKSLAEKFSRKVEGELAAGLCTVGKKRTTWATFRQQYLDDVASTKAPETQKLYERAFDQLAALVPVAYVDAITTATIDRFTSRRLGDVEAATVNKELRHLRAAMRKAVDWGMLDRAPTFAMLREPERDPYFIDDATFAALYDACDAVARPGGRRYAAKEWWQALLAFAYLTGWRIGEILALRRADVDLEAGVAVVDAENTKGRRTARVELHPVVIDHLEAIAEFTPLVFDWPHHERTLWADFTAIKAAAKVEFDGAFHRFRFGYANNNCDRIPEDLLQKLMRHRDRKTTRRYIDQTQRMKRAGTAALIHVPDVLKVAATG
jgi:integrase